MCRPRPSLTALFLIASACHINNPAARRPSRRSPAGQATISGKIVDASAAPIAGAQVTLYRLESLNSRWGRFKVEHAAVAADGAGTYKFPGLGDGYFMVSVERRGSRGRSTLRPSRPTRHSRSTSCSNRRYRS